MSEQLSNTTNIEVGAAHHVSTKEANKVALGALVGGVLEWYDFFLFSAASALVFNVQYFKTGDPTISALASFATFGVGLLARPLGGLLFGHLGDRIGRRPILMITIVGIGIVTGLIGVLPTYAAIGVWAPVLLVLLRIAQGLFVGGEWSGGMTIVVENAPLERRAMFAAIPQLASPIATILSSGGFFLVRQLSQDTFDSWGWRIPFLAAIPLLVLAFYVRSRLEESPVFHDLTEAGEIVKSPIADAFRTSWLQLIVGMCVALLGVAGFYLIAAFVVWYGTNILGYDAGLMLFGSMCAAAVEIPVLLAGGRLGMRFGASKVVIWGGIASAVLATPVFFMIASHNTVLIVLGMVIGVAALSFPYAASGTVLTGLFHAKTRYTGVSLAQNTSGMVAGFVPALTTGWVAIAGDAWWPALVMLVILSLLTAFAGMAAPRLSVHLPGFKH